MSEEFMVVEVIDHTAPNGVRNIYISLDRFDENGVANGFKALRESGQPPTGTVSYTERVNGVHRRIEQPRSRNLFEKGFRTMSAFLRA